MPLTIDDVIEGVLADVAAEQRISVEQVRAVEGKL